MSGYDSIGQFKTGWFRLVQINSG